jgi:8-oxo-dGTP diphosphatase / 2-hydroxy-dATP diphosphatase
MQCLTFRATAQEEACITADLEHCATVFFVSEGAEAAMHVDYYRATSYTGTPTEFVHLRWNSIYKA